MAHSDDDRPGSAIPEADRLEQEQFADPRVGNDHPWPAQPSNDADEADRLEQAVAVDGDPDEDYTPSPG
jgi:hypothetical protein